ncbi:MAG: transposase [Burkholderiaceae bacterium]|nr:transposase [Burkholderiaceae bacterium]
MFETALDKLAGQDGPLLHSDQGWPYRMLIYRRHCAERGLTQSMSRKGNCLDHATIKSFFGTLKSEFLNLNRFDSVEQLQNGI